MTNKVENFEDAAYIITEYEEIIRTKKASFICIAYQQRKVFKKFKDKYKFTQMVKNFVSKIEQSSLK